jgi:hypothetical protein
MAQQSLKAMKIAGGLRRMADTYNQLWCGMVSRKDGETAYGWCALGDKEHL